MGEQLMINPRVYAVQNGMAACIFLLLLTAETLAYLLHSFPSVEMLWVLTISANRIAGPFLSVADHAIQMPFVLLAVLAFTVVVPIVAYRRRSWLGTAVSGHVALGLCVMLTYEAMKRENTGHLTASNAMAFDPAILNSGILSLIAVTLVMAILCLLNHIVFFVRPKTL
jgi:hypothetical protein